MWYIVQVEKGTEVSSCEQCREMLAKEWNCRVFVPQFICFKKYQQEWRRERKILIPGCFFVEITEDENVRRILQQVQEELQIPDVRPTNNTEDKAVSQTGQEGYACSLVYPEEQTFLNSIMEEDGTVPMSKGDIVNGQFQISQDPLRYHTERIRKMNRHKRMAEMELTLHGESRRVLIGLEIVSKS